MELTSGWTRMIDADDTEVVPRIAAEKRGLEDRIEYDKDYRHYGNKEAAEYSLYQNKQRLEKLLSNPEEYFLSRGGIKR